jgi:hypothetical protein
MRVEGYAIVIHFVEHDRFRIVLRNRNVEGAATGFSGDG